MGAYYRRNYFITSCPIFHTLHILPGNPGPGLRLGHQTTYRGRSITLEAHNPLSQKSPPFPNCPLFYFSSHSLSLHLLFLLFLLHSYPQPPLLPRILLPFLPLCFILLHLASLHSSSPILLLPCTSALPHALILLFHSSISPLPLTFLVSTSSFIFHPLGTRFIPSLLLLLPCYPQPPSPHLSSRSPLILRLSKSIYLPSQDAAFSNITEVKLNRYPWYKRVNQSHVQTLKKQTLTY